MSAPPEKRAKVDDFPSEECLISVRDNQAELDKLSEQASEEILLVEVNFNKQRAPLYEKRQKMIQKLDKQSSVGFWSTAFRNHPMLGPLLGPEGDALIRYLQEIEVIEQPDIKSGYEIKFTFEENPHFDNKVLTKVFGMTPEGTTKNETTEIIWRREKNLITKNWKEGEEEDEFFTWLSKNHDDTSDDIADFIKDDLWTNPYQYFLGITEEDEESEEECFEEEE